MSAFEDVVEAWGFKIAGDKPAVLSPAGIAPDGSIVYSDAESFRDLIGAEPELGNPSVNGWILSSSSAGVRSWVAPNAHSHAIADVTGLQATLDAKMATASHPDLVAIEALAGTSGLLRKTAANTWSLDTASYALSSAIPAASSTTPSALGTASVGTGTTWARADHVHAMPTAAQVGAAASAHTHAIADVTGLQTALDAKQAVLGYVPVNKAGDTMTGNLTVNGWIEADGGYRDANGVQRISAGGAGTLTTLNTTGLADLASARIQNLTASQMVATDGSKNLVSWDAGTARANLGITRDWGSATDGVPAWVKVARMRITVAYGTASFSARATDIGRYGPKDYGTADVVGRIRLNGSMSSPLSLVNLIMSRQGETDITFGYVVDVDNSTEKVVSVYVALSGWRGAIASAIASSGDVSFLSGQPLLTSAPAGYIQATWAASTVGSIMATSQAGTGSRLVQAGADGTQSASIPVPTAFAQTLLDDADAAAARATLGAAAFAHSHAIADVTGLQTTLDGKMATASHPDLVAIEALAGTSGFLKKTAANAWALDTTAYSTLALGETSTTAYRGDRGKTAYDHSQATGNPHGTAFADLAAKPTTLAGYGITDPISRRLFSKSSPEVLTINSTSRSIYTFGSNNVGSVDIPASAMTLGAKILARSSFSWSQTPGTVLNYQSSFGGTFTSYRSWSKVYSDSSFHFRVECVMGPSTEATIITRITEINESSGEATSKTFVDVLTVSKGSASHLGTSVDSSTSQSVTVFSADHVYM